MWLSRAREMIKSRERKPVLQMVETNFLNDKEKQKSVYSLLKKWYKV